MSWVRFKIIRSRCVGVGLSRRVCVDITRSAQWHLESGDNYTRQVHCTVTPTFEIFHSNMLAVHPFDESGDRRVPHRNRYFENSTSQIRTRKGSRGRCRRRKASPTRLGRTGGGWGPPASAPPRISRGPARSPRLRPRRPQNRCVRTAPRARSASSTAAACVRSRWKTPPGGEPLQPPPPRSGRA